MFVSIYNATLGKRISEQYRVCMDQKGVPKDPVKLLKTYSIFLNLESSDIAQNLYLMIEMVRFGPFETKEAEMIGSSLPIQGGGTAQRSKMKNQNNRRLQVFMISEYSYTLTLPYQKYSYTLKYILLFSAFFLHNYYLGYRIIILTLYIYIFNINFKRKIRTFAFLLRVKLTN